MAGNSWWGGLTDQITSMAKDVLQEGTEEVDDHATELQLEKKKTADLNNQITSLKAENGRLDEKVRELNESIEMNDVQLKNINSEYKSLIQDKEAELNTLKTTINELNETNQHLTNQRTDNSVFSSTHSHYNTHHFAGEDAAISALSLGDPLEGHDDDISEILNYQREVNRLHRELDTANSEIKLLRRQINQSPTVNKQPQMVDLTLQAQNSELQTKIQGLESELRSLSDKYENDLSVINQQNLNKQEELRYELEQKLEQHKIILQTEFVKRRKELEEKTSESVACSDADHESQIKKIAALQARINDLERDLEEKASKYKDDRQDLIEAETRELSDKLIESESRLARYKSEAEASKDEVERLIREAEGYKNELDSLREDKNELEQSMDELDKDHELALQQLITQRDELKRNNETLHMQISDLSNTSRGDNSENVKTLHVDLERVTCTLNELHQDKQQLEQELKNNKAKLKLLADKYKDLNLKFKTSEDDLKTTREQLESTQLSQISRDELNSKASEELENLKRQLEQTQMDLTRTNIQLTETQYELERAEKTGLDIQHKYRELSSQHDSTLISLSTTESNYTVSQERITLLENEIHTVNSRLHTEAEGRKEIQLEITTLLQLTETRDHEFKILQTRLEETRQHLKDSQDSELLLKEEVSNLREQVNSFTDSDSPRSTNDTDGRSVSEDELRDQTGDNEPQYHSEAPIEQQLTELKELLAQKVVLINELQSAADRAVSEQSEDSEPRTEIETESEIERLRTELQLSEAEVEEMTRQAKDLEADIRVSTDAQEELMVKYEATVSEMEQLYTENSHLKTEIQSLQSIQQQFQHAQLELTDARARSETLTNQIADLRNKITQLSEDSQTQQNLMQDLETENERLTTESRSAEQELTQLRSQLSHLSEEQASHEVTQISQVTIQINELTNQSESLKKEVERLTNEIEDLTDDNKELTNQNEVYEEELIKMKSGLNIQTKEKNELQFRLQSAEKEIESLRLSLESQVNGSAELTQRNSELEEQLRETERKLQNIISEKNELSTLVSQLETGSATLSEQLDSTEELMNNLQSEKQLLEMSIREKDLQLQTIQSELDEPVQKLNSTVTELNDSRSLTRKLEQENEELRFANERLSEERSHTNSDLTETKNEINSLENQIENLQSEVSTLTEDLEQKTSENDSLQQILMQKDSEISVLQTDRINRVSAPPLLANPADRDDAAQTVASDVDDVAYFEGMTDELKSMKREIEDKDKLIKELVEKNKTLQHTVGVYGDLHQLQDQVKSLTQDKDKLITVLNEKTEENSELKQEVRNLNNRLATNHSNHDEMGDDVTSERSVMNKEAIQKLSALVQDREMQMEALKQKNESLLEILQNMGQTDVVGAKPGDENLIKERDELKIRIEKITGERNQIYTALQQKHQEAVSYHTEAVRLTELVKNLEENQKKEGTTPLENGTSTPNDNQHTEESFLIVQENDKLKMDLSSLRLELNNLKSHKAEIEVNSLQGNTNADQSHEINQPDQIQINKQISDLESLVHTVTDQRDQANSTLSTLTQTNTELKEQNTRLTSDLQQYNNQLQLLLQERQRIAVDIQSSNSEKLTLQTQCERLNKEVGRLREHLLTVEQTQTEEMLVYEEREKELRDRLATAEHQAISSGELVGQARNEQSQYINTLTSQLGTVVRERDDLCRKLIQSESEGRQLSTELENLQLVLEQIQQEHDSIHASHVASLQQQLSDSNAELSSLRTEVDRLNSRLDEQRETVEAAGRISEQLDKKDQVIDMLQAEVEQRERQIRDCEVQIRKLNQTNELKVEKQLVRNLFLNYFSAPRSKQTEVLALISRFLSFSEEDNQKIGLLSQGWMSGLFSRFSSTGAAQPNQTEFDKSFSEMFVKFLEAESTPKSKPLPLSVDRLVADRPQPAHTEKRKSLSESTFNPFIAPTSTSSIPLSIGQRSTTGLVGGASQQSHPLLVGISSSGVQSLRQSSPLLSLSNTSVSITTQRQPTQQTTPSVPTLLAQPNLHSTFTPIVTPTNSHS